MQRLAGRSRGGRRHRGPLRLPRERDQRDESPTSGGDGHASRHGDDAVGVRARDDVRQPGGAPDRVAERRRAVVVERGEGARDEPGEEVSDRRGDDPAQRLGTGVARSLGAVAREHGRELVGRERARRGSAGGRRAPARSRIPPPPASRRSSLRARKRREDGDANRLRRRHHDHEDAVRGEESVRLVGPPELAGDDHPDDRREAAHDEEGRRRQGRRAEGSPGRASLYACSPTRKRTDHAERHSLDRRALDDLRGEVGDVYDGRTVLVTGADGFMGSHLTDALVELGANVHAFVRATSSGALNNIGHLRDRLKVHFADLTDRTSVDYLVRELKDTAPDRPYVFHLGAQAHVGESWHRPYETVAANVLGTLNLLQSVVDVGLELEKFDTAGTSEEYGNVRESVSDHHDFDDEGGLILHERSPINPKSIYATAKVAADFLTMNYHDAFGVPGVVTRMFNNYGPRQNPRYVTGTIITQALTRETIELGALDPLRDFCFCTDGVRGHLDRRRAGHARRRLRLRPGREHLDA